MKIRPATLALELGKYSVVACICLFSYLSPTGGILASLIICLVLLGLEPLLFGLLQRKINFFSPHVLIPITYTLYALGPIAGYEWISSEVKRDYLVMFVAGMAALRLGLLFGIGKARTSTSKEALVPEWRNIKKIFLYSATFLFLLSIPSVLSHIRAFGGLSNLIAIGYGTDRQTVLATTFRFGPGFSWLVLALLMYAFYGLKQSIKWMTVSAGIGVLVVSYLLVLIGARSTLVYCSIFAAVLIHFGYKQIAKNALTVALVSGIVAAQVFSLARPFLDSGVSEAVKSSIEVVQRRPDLLLPTSYGEFIAPSGSLLEVLQYGGPDRQYGFTYVTALGSPIPGMSRLLGFYRFDLSRWRLEKFYPDVLAEGGGRGFSPVTEGYINFGFGGIMLAMFVYGWTIGSLYRRLILRPSIWALLLFAGALPLFMMEGLRIQSATFIHKLFRSYFAPAIVLFLVRVVARNK